ncbi:MAG TPA: hypothetical protein VIY48_13315 [Candidatus Paceibacterota bacterium]
MPKVFITQLPHKRDPVTKALVPSINITPATEHGELVFMMPPQASFHATGDLVAQMKKHLKEYDFEAGDSIVALGDPAIIAVAFGILGKYNNKFNVLKWDRNLGRYVVAKVVI